MYRVADTIVFSEAWLRHYPEKRDRYGEGLLVVLDAKDTTKGFKKEAKEAIIAIPGFPAKSLLIDLVEEKSGLVGLFFRGAKEEDIPRGATITVA